MHALVRLNISEFILGEARSTLSLFPEVNDGRT